MTDTINFLLNNKGLLLSTFIITAVGTALLTFHYFFIYQYVINKRLQNPDKTYRLKWPVPKFACIIFAVLTLLGSLCFYKGSWITHYEFTDFQTNDEIQQTDKAYTYDELKKNTNYTLYELKSDHFQYSLFYNDHYNGIINNKNLYGSPSGNIQDCEYIIFIQRIDDSGSVKTVSSDDIYDVMLYHHNYSNNDSIGIGNGIVERSLSELPLCIFGSTDHYNGIELNLQICTKEMYGKKETDLYDENIEYDSSELNEYGEKDYWYLSESFSFDIDNKKISRVQTKELKENF